MRTQFWYRLTKFFMHMLLVPRLSRSLSAFQCNTDRNCNDIWYDNNYYCCTAACSHHIPLRQGVVSDIPVTMTDVVHEGINMTLSCLSGLTLVGSNTSTCTENGQWEPNPWEVECVHLGQHNCNNFHWIFDVWSCT